MSSIHEETSGSVAINSIIVINIIISTIITSIIIINFIIRTRSDFEKHFTIKNCDKTFLKIILRLKKLLKSDDVSTLAECHYQVKIS